MRPSVTYYHPLVWVRILAAWSLLPRSGYVRSPASLAVKKQLDGQEVLRCQKASPGLFSQFISEQWAGHRITEGSDGEYPTASWGSHPFARTKAIGPCLSPSCGTRELLVLQPTATTPPSGTHSVPLWLVWLSPQAPVLPGRSPGPHALVTESLMWWLIFHLHAFKPGACSAL